MNAPQYGAKIAYDVSQLKDMTGEQKYEKIFKDHPDFTKTFPIVVKYMCIYQIFNVEFFKELIDAREKERANLERSLELQADYLCKLIHSIGHTKLEAKKISNLELAQAQQQLNKIKRETKNLKKQYENEKKDAMRVMRKELADFVLNL